MEDIFEQLGNIFKPYFQKFENMHNELKHDIQKGIIEDMMNAKTISELEAIKAFNSDYFDIWSTELSLHYESAAKRIKNIILMYKDVMGFEMLN
jgi:hypothetical protein